ncbi:MAG: cytochrome b N-terminal domain-containing protein [Anaerolineae bacterium]
MWRDFAKRRWTLKGTRLAIERPITHLARPQYNPLYHTGTISLFLLILIAVTGVYLTMFYQFGFSQSYAAVARIGVSPVGRIMRGLHRYASSLALLTAVLHSWRTFFMDRFRGPRWLAWVTGIALALLVWAGGVTGYWLINDQRAQVLNQTLIRL